MSPWRYTCLLFLLILCLIRPNLLAQDAATQVPTRPAAEALKPSSNPKLSLHFVDADLHDVLRILAEEGNCNLVVTDDVQAKVTLRFNGVTWKQALNTIAQVYGLTIRRQDNVVWVGYAVGE